MLIRLTIVLLLGIGASTLWAQTAPAPALSQMSKLYQLTPEQEAELATILARELRNISEIASLRTSAPDEYLERMRAIRKSTRAATRRMLNDTQRQLFQAASQRERSEWAQRYKALQMQGLSPTEIELQLTAEYLEEKGW
ncbi:MAG: hypothetical protein D6772_07800 [Bacteroidetes bacterium]|nr:MAG: hypothetical protein D6772_07800 [Bacteroidota bacterium]